MVMAMNTRAVPRSGCSMISAIGQRRPRRAPWPAGARRCRPSHAREQRGQRDDQHQLGQLGRLELEAGRAANQACAPFDRRAERRDHQRQQQARWPT